MNTIGPQFNPLSSQFTQKALHVATTHAATVKTKKDTEPQQKESKDLAEDSVMLSQQEKPSESAKSSAAHHSGVMSELSKRERKNEDAGELSMFGGETEVYDRKGFTKTEASPKGKDEVDNVEMSDRLDARAIMERNPKEIMADVPEGFAAASKKIVEGQIRKGQPTKELTGLKEVPDTAMVDLEPVRTIDIMPIHDTNNKPINVEMGANLN